MRHHFGSRGKKPLAHHLLCAFFICSTSIEAMVSSSSAMSGKPQSGQNPVLRCGSTVSSSTAASHFPVFHPGHRSSSATPRSALSMCKPHPAQVNLPHCVQSHFRHMIGKMVGEGGAATASVRCALSPPFGCPPQRVGSSNRMLLNSIAFYHNHPPSSLPPAPRPPPLSVWSMPSVALKLWIEIAPP